MIEKVTNDTLISGNTSLIYVCLFKCTHWVFIHVFRKMMNKKHALMALLYVTSRDLKKFSS